MSQAAKAQEPSMEEILASIRRIIADDDAAKPAARSLQPRQPAAPPPRPAAMPPRHPVPPSPSTAGGPPPPPRHGSGRHRCDAGRARCAAGDAAPQADDVLELTERWRRRPRPSRRASGPSRPGRRGLHRRARPAGAAAARGRGAARGSRAPSDACRDRAMLSSRHAAAVDSAFNALAQTVLVQNARTLEDLVKEMLRPMLKAWLDDNLPGLVERIVRGRDRARLARAQLSHVRSPLQPPREPERQQPATAAPHRRTAAARRSGRSPAPRARRRPSGREIHRGEQRDRGAARLRRHLGGVGLQRVVQHEEAEADRRAPRAARNARSARRRASGSESRSARRRRSRGRSGRAAAPAAAPSPHRSGRRRRRRRRRGRSR